MQQLINSNFNPFANGFNNLNPANRQAEFLYSHAFAAAVAAANNNQSNLRTSSNTVTNNNQSTTSLAQSWVLNMWNSVWTMKLYKCWTKNCPIIGLINGNQFNFRRSLEEAQSRGLKYYLINFLKPTNRLHFVYTQSFAN